MRDLPSRTITAAIYGGLFLAAGLPGPVLTFAVPVLFAVGLLELWRLARALPSTGKRGAAFVAGLIVLGGGLFAQATLAFEPNDFDPVASSLFWFTAVVVFGADSAAAAVAAAGLIVAVGSSYGPVTFFDAASHTYF